MGQYLAIGLVTEINISKENVEDAKINTKQLQTEMINQLHFLPEIFNLTETDKYYKFKLKDEIFHSQLIPFLEKFYPKIYLKDSGYSTVIDELKNKPATEWLTWANDKPEEEFQFDSYGTRDYLEIKNKSIKLNYNAIMLSMEGKILMEEYGRQFNFFKYCMIQTFAEFLLASALRVYITG